VVDLRGLEAPLGGALVLGQREVAGHVAAEGRVDETAHAFALGHVDQGLDAAAVHGFERVALAARERGAGRADDRVHSVQRSLEAGRLLEVADHQSGPGGQERLGFFRRGVSHQRDDGLPPRAELLYD
jgi:hypothetical protein